MGIPLHSHFGLNTGYNICYPWYIEIGNIYRTLKIQNPGNIGQYVENIGVCASISALTKHHQIINCTEVVTEHSLFNLAIIT